MMMTTYGKSKPWMVVGDCVTGAIHIRQERICQDAIYIHSPNPKYALACVADGHGSASCPYSDEGARIAVDLVGKLLSGILEDDTDPLATLSAHKDIWLPKQIETHWKDAVRSTHALKWRKDQENGENQGKFPYILYGTTLLALAATDSFVFALQIGDGNILIVDQDGSARPILSNTEGLASIGEDTESLCMDDAWKYIQTQIIPWNENSNGMFLLSTDGYANSFTDTKGFIKAGADFHRIWQEEGHEYIRDNLLEWLRQSSDKGSGDDIALALIAR